MLIGRCVFDCTLTGLNCVGQPVLAGPLYPSLAVIGIASLVSVTLIVLCLLLVLPIVSPKAAACIYLVLDLMPLLCLTDSYIANN
jgi:hypothetical protein